MKQNELIKSWRDVGKPRTKERDRIWARCLRTRVKRKGSNLDAMLKNLKNKRKVSNMVAMPENPNQTEGIESGHNVGEPEIKKEGIKSRCNGRELE